MEILPLRRAVATVLIAALVPAVEMPGPVATVAEPPGIRVWAARGRTDWIRRVPSFRFAGFGFGGDPVSGGFGARVFSAGQAEGHPGPPGVPDPSAKPAPQRGIPSTHRRRMGRIPRPLRAPQGLHRTVRPRLLHPLHPRACMPEMFNALA